MGRLIASIHAFPTGARLNLGGIIIGVASCSPLVIPPARFFHALMAVSPFAYAVHKPRLTAAYLQYWTVSRAI